MKKRRYLLVLLSIFVLTACGKSEDNMIIEDQVTETDFSTFETLEEEEAEGPYAAVLDKVRTAMIEQWDLNTLYDHEMSSYYTACKLENLGYVMKDLDHDGKEELLIGAITDDEYLKYVIFEMYTWKEDAPVQLFASYEKNTYFLGSGEDGIYEITCAATNSAFSNGYLYYTFTDGSLNLMQTVIFDGNANPENPWYMGCDTDWDVSNDQPIDEEMAKSLMDSYESRRIVPEYQKFPE